jgi:hypothetical protein
MTYDVIETGPDQWNVEAIDTEGLCYVAIFSGPKAYQRAREYKHWKNPGKITSGTEPAAESA